MAGGSSGSAGGLERSLVWQMERRCRDTKGRRAQIRLSPELQRRIALLAGKEGMDFSDWCARALEGAVRQAERDGAIDEALEGVRAGDL